MYRIGRLGWKLAARAGVPLNFRVRVYRDDETGTFWAESDDLDGLVVSGDSLDDVYRDVTAVAHSLLDLSLHGAPAKATADMHVFTPVPCAA